MTLPFRRRHHDDEASHDRARALISASFLGPLADTDQAWLDGHLAGCPECRADREGYVADRAMLQALRATPPAPPRDLWARTSAAIERERASRARRGFLDRALGPAPRGIPIGPLAGAAVAAVVLAVAVWPRGTAAPALGTPPNVAVGSTTTPAPTTIDVDNQVAWLQRDDNGTYSLYLADINQVCPSGDQQCAPLPTGSPTRVELNAPPQAVVLAPDSGQVAVVGSDAEGTVTIIDVPTPAPSGALASPVATPTLPVESAAGSPLPSSAGPQNEHRIISGVVIVGTPAYAADGSFAFSARPRDGSAGPDIYVWHPGDRLARQLTFDGESYFAGWFDNRIVASSVRDVAAPEGSTAPDSSVAPAGTPVATTPAPGGSAAAGSSTGPATGPELHPYSFLLDPTSNTRTEFARDDVWLPSIDGKGRFVTYWAGTVIPSPDGHGFQPASGALVLDGWSEPIVAPEPSASDLPTASDQAPNLATAAPDDTAPPQTTDSDAPASLGPVPSASSADGPAGTQVVLVPGPIADFDARFDPTGTRLAVWTTSDLGDPEVGPLWLLVLDPIAGGPNATLQTPLPAPGVVALRGFSLDDGRLGWVTPAGQNGQPSSISVLAWKGDAFGQIQTVPGRNPQIVR